jgi:hypothetical protein
VVFFECRIRDCVSKDWSRIPAFGSSDLLQLSSIPFFKSLSILHMCLMASMNRGVCGAILQLTLAVMVQYVGTVLKEGVTMHNTAGALVLPP